MEINIPEHYFTRSKRFIFKAITKTEYNRIVLQNGQTFGQFQFPFFRIPVNRQIINYYCSIGKIQHSHLKKIQTSYVSNQLLEQIFSINLQKIQFIYIKNDNLEPKYLLIVLMKKIPNLKYFAVQLYKFAKIQTNYCLNFEDIQLIKQIKYDFKQTFSLCDSWTNLITLTINGMSLQNQAIKEIVKGKWPNLRSIDINDNFMTSDGLKYLVKNNWKHIQNIKIHWNPIGYDAFDYLNKGNLDNLSELTFSQSKKKKKGFTRKSSVIEALPKLAKVNNKQPFYVVVYSLRYQYHCNKYHIDFLISPKSIDQLQQFQCKMIQIY